MTNQPNPLQEFFRKPAHKIRLPSRGRYWPSGALATAGNEPLEIFPMTALDGIAYHAPSSLLNGEILVPVIESCVPGILDAWSVPACDLLTVILGMHIATYGHTAAVDSQCPACTTDQKITVDLANLLDHIDAVTYQDLNLDNLIIRFHPLSYRQISEHGNIETLHEKTLRVLGDDSITEQVKSKQLNQLLKSIMSATMAVMNQSIQSINTANGTITDKEHIQEFVKKCTREVFIAVKEHIVSFKESTENHPVDTVCGHCQHQYQHLFSTDQIRFVRQDIAGIEILT
jgi:bacterioferritin-associated ferredoxin